MPRIQRVMLLGFVAVVLVTLLVGETAVAEQQFGILRGRVVDAQTGEVVARARLRLTAYGMTAVADDLGVYVFTGVPVGATTLIVSAPGYRDYVQNIQVFGGEQTLDVLLQPVRARGVPPAVAPGARVAAEPSPVGTGLYVAGGYASLSPKEFNAFLDDMNKLFTYTQQLKALQGYTTQLETLEPVDRGLWGEAGLRIMGPPVMFAIGVQYLKPVDTTARLGSSASDLLTYDSGWVYDYRYTSSPYYDSYYGTYVYTVTDYYTREQTYVTGSDNASFRIMSSVIGPVGQVGIILGQRPVSLSLLASAGYFWLSGEATSSYSSQWTYDTVESTYYYRYVYCYRYYYYYSYCDSWSGSYTSGTSSSSVASSDTTVTRFRGQTFGWEGRLVLSLSMSERAALEASLGYQNLRFDRLTDEKTGEPLKDFRGTVMPLDLSGLRASMALALRF